jgi:site-specific DNA recombinase
MVHCTCGKKMYVYHVAPVYDCRPCKKKIAVADLDEIFQSQLKSFLMTDRQVSDFNKSTDAKIKVKEALLAKVSKEAEVLSKTIENLVNLRINGELDKERFAVQYRPAEDRLKLLENQLPELQAEVDFLKIQYASSDVILTDARNLYDRWPDLSFEEKRTIVETITEKITVGAEDISIKLSYLPTFSENTGKSQHEHVIM